MKLIVILPLFFSLIANSQSSILQNWKTLNETSYSISYPDSFDLNTSGQMGMSFILFSKQTSSQDLFRENVNLIIQDLSTQKIDLNQFVEISESQIKTMITLGNIIESKRIQTPASEFQKIIFTGMQGQYNLKFEQYYWFVNDKAYVLTLTCESKEFENYKNVGEQILNSFRIK